MLCLAYHIVDMNVLFHVSTQIWASYMYLPRAEHVTCIYIELKMLHVSTQSWTCYKHLHRDEHVTSIYTELNMLHVSTQSWTCYMYLHRAEHVIYYLLHVSWYIIHPLVIPCQPPLLAGDRNVKLCQARGQTLWEKGVIMRERIM